MELVDALLEMGMDIAVCGLVFSAIFVFELTPFVFLFLFFLDMSSFNKQLAPPPARRSQAGASRPSALTLAPASIPPPAHWLQQGDVSAAGPSACRDKRKQPAKFEPTNPPLVNPKSLMAESNGAAMEAQYEQVVLERMSGHPVRCAGSVHARS